MSIATVFMTGCNAAPQPRGRTAYAALLLFAAAIVAAPGWAEAADAAVRGQSAAGFAGPWSDAKAKQSSMRIAQGWKYPLDFPTGDSHGAPIVHTVMDVLGFKHSGEAEKLVLIASAPRGYSCHACAPLIGAIRFGKANGRWRVLHEQPNVLSFGANGKPARASVRRVGPDDDGILFTMNAMSAGYETTSAALVAMVGPDLKEVLSLELGEDNAASGAQGDARYRWTASLEFLPGSNARYYDIRSTASGTRADPSDTAGLAKPFTSVIVYRWLDDRYRPDANTQ